MHADLLVLLSDVDGLYDADPTLPGSNRISEVAASDDLAKVKIGKTGAAGVAAPEACRPRSSRLGSRPARDPVILTSADQAGAALAGERCGTWFHATGRRKKTRLLWLAHATEGKGRLTLDPGAVRAVARRASLLAAGIVGVEGAFVAGDR